MNWSLPTEEIFQVHGQNRPVAYLLVVDFRSQPREIPSPKPLNTLLSVFLFRILVFFPFQKSLNVTVCKRHEFFILIAAIIENKNDLGLRVVKALPFIHQPDREARKANDVSTAYWRYQTLVKKKAYFFTSVITAFLRAGNPCLTPQFT